MLKIDNLKVSLEEEEKQIIKGLSLSINPGEIHAIMGPNGSGKSTLSSVLAGKDGYTVDSGNVTFEGRNLLEAEVEERAALGIFMAFQYPIEIPGVGNMNFLRTALNSQRKTRGQEELRFCASADNLSYGKLHIVIITMAAKRPFVSIQYYHLNALDQAGTPLC